MKRLLQPRLMSESLSRRQQQWFLGWLLSSEAMIRSLSTLTCAAASAPSFLDRNGSNVWNSIITNTYATNERSCFSTTTAGFTSGGDTSNDSVLVLLRDVVECLRKEGKDTVLAGASLSRDLQSTLEKVCCVYPTLPPIVLSSKQQKSERQAILTFLASDCGVDPDKVSRAIQAYQQDDASSGPTRLRRLQVTTTKRTATTTADLRDACTPVYEHLVHLLVTSAPQGFALLVALRADLLAWIPALLHQHKHTTKQTYPKDDHDDDLIVCRHLQALESHLRSVLHDCLTSPGRMQVERITYDTTSAAVMEQIAKHEAVHPIQDLSDLRERLGPDRRVFGLYSKPLLPTAPLVVLHVSLQKDGMPSSMHQVRTASSQESATTATFYSISNLQAGLAGLGLGEHLIKQGVAALRSEFPDMTTFCTLSPLPRFHKWLLGRLSLAQRTQKFASHDTQLVPENDLNLLANALGCDDNEAMAGLLERLSPHTTETKTLQESLEKLGIQPSTLVPTLVTRLVARYLVLEKHRGKPLDGVARFHLANGASLARINWAADPSQRGWVNSLGCMVNYRYDLERIQINQQAFPHTLSVEDAVLSLLETNEENAV